MLDIPITLGGEFTRIRIEERDLADVIDSSLVYLKTATLESKELKQDTGKLITYEYKCDQQKCQFESVINAMKDNADLKAYGTKNLLETVVKEIELHQDIFLPRNLDGFLFQITGIPLLHLKNTTPRISGERVSQRTGFLDITEVRKRAIYKQEKSSYALIDVVASAAVFIIGYTASVFTWPRILKKIPK